MKVELHGTDRGDPPRGGGTAPGGPRHGGSGPAAASPAHPDSWRNRLARVDLKATPYVLIAPFFLIFAAFGLFPLVYTFWVSLHDWHLINGDQGWAGFENYTRLFGDEYFWNALFNTISLFILSTIPQLLIALGLAALLNTRLRARTFFRAGVLVPNVVSVVAVALVFAQIFGRDFGIANWLLGLVGIGEGESGPIDWQADRLMAHIAISVIVTWRWTGYNALIYLAAMQAIPTDLYEAARVDGASAWRTFWSVTVPMIRPTVIFTAIISTIGGLQLFAEPLLFDPAGLTSGSGGSERQFQTLTMYLYENGFSLFNSGYASAIAWVLFLLVVVMAAINLLLTRRLVSGK
jgi:cellobiose transport system permease protein